MMPRMVSLALLILAAAPLLLASEAGAVGTDPQIVLDEIYGQVAEMCGSEGDGRAYDIAEIARVYFAPALAKKINRALESGSLDFDVLVDGNDCKVTSLDLRVVDEGATEAVGRAEFENFGEERTIDLVMAKSDGDWKVTDIVYRHRQFSLKALR
jgi:hypothetical protein